MGAPQQRPDAGEQLAEIERLGEVVVGSGVEAGDAVSCGGSGGEHQDRHTVAFAAQHPTHGETVDDGHRHVEEDGVGGVAGQPERALRRRS